MQQNPSNTNGPSREMLNFGQHDSPKGILTLFALLPASICNFPVACTLLFLSGCVVCMAGLSDGASSMRRG